MFEQERTILLGVLAIQLRGISAQRMAGIAAACLRDSPEQLGKRVVAEGLLSQADWTKLEVLADEAIQAHGGDTRKALSIFGANAFVQSVMFEGARLREPGPDSITLKYDPSVYSEGAPLAAPGVEETPGRYTGEGEYARGGMGRVLLVHDEHLDRDVALKELLPHAPETGDVPTPVRISMSKVARFLQEARITGQLEHPSIVPVYELGRRREGSLYYTMKLVRGRTLSQVLRASPNLGGRLSLLTHFLDLCNAIAYAHSRGVLHRDIKSSNVMIGEFGETVVLDWGLAKHRSKKDVHAEALAETLHLGMANRDYTPDPTQYGQVLGTPHYMAPEQAQGKLDEVDERSDVYSLGAVLYQILSGAPPYDGTSHYQVLHDVVAKEPRPIREIVPDVPEELAAICTRALQKSPKLRYQSAKELAADVQRYLSGALVQAYRYKFSEHLRRFVRRNKAVLGAAAAGVAVLLAVWAYYNVHLYRARTAEREQRIAAEAANRKLSWENYATSLAEVRNNIMEQNWPKAEEILLRQPAEYRAWEWGRLLRECRSDVYAFKDDPRKGMTGMPMRAIVSPDGGYVLNMHDFGGVKTIFDVQGGEVTYISPPDRFLGMPWCSNFTRNPNVMAFGKDDATVELYDIRRDAVIAQFSSGPGWLSSFVLSPDESLAAGYRTDPGTGDREIIVWKNPDGQEVRRIPMRPIRPNHYADSTWAVRQETPDGLVLSFMPDGKRLVCTDDQLCTIDTLTSERRDIASCRMGVAAYAPAAKTAAVWAPDGTIELYSIKTAERLCRTEEKWDSIRNLEIARDGKTFGVTFGRNWGLFDATGQTVRVYDADNGGVSSLVFHPGGTCAVTYGSERVTKFWDLTHDTVTDRIPFKDANGAVVGPQLRYNIWPSFVYAVTPSADRLVLGFPDGRISIWRLPELRRDVEWTAHAGPVTALAIGPNADRMVSCSADGTVKAWREGSDAPVWTLSAEAISFPKSLCFSPDGARIAVGFVPKRPAGEAPRELWTPFGMEEMHPKVRHAWMLDADSGAKVGELDDHVYATSMIDYTPDGTTIVRGSWGRPDTDEKCVEFFDANTGLQRPGDVKALGWVHSAEFVPGTTRVFLLGVSLEPVLYDWGEAREIYRLARSNAFRVVVHPDGRRFFAIDHSRHQMTVHAIDDGRVLATVKGVMAPAFLAADGATMYTGNVKGDLRAFYVDNWNERDETRRDAQRLARLHTLLGAAP